MSDSGSTGDGNTGNTPATATPTPTPTPPASNNQPARSVEELPQWAQDQITSLRNEAAGHRVSKREAADQATQAAEQKYAAQINELTQARDTGKTELANAKAENTKLRAALEAGVPSENAVEVAGRLRGDTDEEIRADAKRMKELLGSGRVPAHDPSQGLGAASSNSPADAFGNFILGQLSS